MSDSQIALLKHFVTLCRANPEILYQPNMAFYKDYLESLGATLPPKPVHASDKPKTSQFEEQSFHEDDKKDESMEVEEEIPPVELDQTGVITPDEDAPLPMGDISKEVTESELEQANESRNLATEAFNEGDYQKAVEQFTKAIELNPGSAILHAKRANALLKLSKPVAAIRDCDKAIAINADSAQGYKFRGRANRLLGKWLEAHKDLATACKLDWDETANEWLKEVEPNAKKLQEYNRTKERHIEEKELKERRERVERARAANKRAAEETAAHGDKDEEEEFGADGGFGMGGFSELLKELSDDPELLEAIKNDPTLIKKLTEIMSNPQNMLKYMNDPAVMKLIGKLGSKFGAGGAPPNFGSASQPMGQEDGGGSSNKSSAEGVGKKTFMDDVD